MPFQDQSFPRQRIIRNRLDFERLFENSHSRQGRFVFVNYRTLENPSAFRVAFACGKRIGGAVERNKYKRRMREIVRKNQSVCAGLEFIIVAKSFILKSNYNSLCRDILDVLQHIQEKKLS